MLNATVDLYKRVRISVFFFKLLLMDDLFIVFQTKSLSNMIRISNSWIWWDIFKSLKTDHEIKSELWGAEQKFMLVNLVKQLQSGAQVVGCTKEGRNVSGSLKLQKSLLISMNYLLYTWCVCIMYIIFCK